MCIAEAARRWATSSGWNPVPSCERSSSGSSLRTRRSRRRPQRHLREGRLNPQGACRLPADGLLIATGGALLLATAIAAGIVGIAGGGVVTVRVLPNSVAAIDPHTNRVVAAGRGRGAASRDRVRFRVAVGRQPRRPGRLARQSRDAADAPDDPGPRPSDGHRSDSRRCVGGRVRHKPDGEPDQQRVR